jgi:hypothetical protein
MVASGDKARIASAARVMPNLTSATRLAPDLRRERHERRPLVPPLISQKNAGARLASHRLRLQRIRAQYSARA